MKSNLRRALTCAAVGAMLIARPGADTRPITEKDLLKFQWVADPQISPDGRQIAYVLVTVNENEDRYDTSVWAVATDGAGVPRQLTAGPRDGGPRWSPDSRTLAFLRAAEKDAPQIYLLSMGGGEGRKLTDLPKGASAAIWAPSGTLIAFTSRTTPEDLDEQRKAREKDKERKESAAEDRGGDKTKDAEKDKDQPKKSDVRVITRAVYRFNGVGYLDPKRHDHIWTVPVAPAGVDEKPAEARMITSGRYDERELVWSHDGSKLYFTSNRVDEPYYNPPDSNVYAVPAAGGDPQVVIDINGPIGDPAPSPDGSRFAFDGFINPPQVQSHTQADVFVFVGGKPADLTAGYDFEIGSDISGDQRPPRGGGEGGIVWTPDGRAVITVTTEHGRSNLVRIDTVAARVEPLTTGDHDIYAYSATPDASRFALAMGDATHIGDVYLFDVAAKKLTQLTHVNDALFSSLNVSAPEEFWYPSFDGRKINGWVLKPPAFDPSKKYPMVLEIHGGPHTAYGHNFYHEIQWMAAKGYVVLYANPRGSTSYGQDFANVIQYRYPGDDYKDLMAGVDEILKRGYVDDKKLGVTGGSGGGLLTNWVVTQTTRFAAAVSQRSVANWSAFWYTADFTLFTPSWFRSTPFQDPEEFTARSPVRYAEKITTPLMLIEGEDDMRTPPGQGGEAMFRALKMQKKPAVMVRFPGETHELSRSGKPSHRVERLQHILNWFDKYLEGRKIDTYDLP